MASSARKTPTPRKWTEETRYTKRIAARIPLTLMRRLRRYVDANRFTVTDVVTYALTDYLNRRGQD